MVMEIRGRTGTESPCFLPGCRLLPVNPVNGEGQQQPPERKISMVPLLQALSSLLFSRAVNRLPHRVHCQRLRVPPCSPRARTGNHYSPGGGVKRESLQALVRHCFLPVTAKRHFSLLANLLHRCFRVGKHQLRGLLPPQIPPSPCFPRVNLQVVWG